MPGWRKSTQFKLIFKVQSKDRPNKEVAPKYLAIHGFDEGTEVKRMQKESWTAMTRKIVENAAKIDESVFEFMWRMGDED